MITRVVISVDSAAYSTILSPHVIWTWSWSYA
jgi:hypothetical protein